MSPANVSKLLKIIAEHYNHFKFTEDKVDAWYMALQDLDDIEVLNAYKRIRREGSEFPPNVGQIEKEVIAVAKQAAGRNAEIAWTDLWAGKGTTDPVAAEAWQRWGGRTRWGALPDVKYDQSAKAHQTVAFARKEFFDLYSRLSEKKEAQSQIQIGHDDATKLLKQLNFGGLLDE